MRINNKGAASIFVILIVVVLATFAGLALTAGWTNKQLAVKSAQSKADYYALDAAAEEIVAETDSLFYEAQECAVSYLNVLSEIENTSLLEKEEMLQALYADGMAQMQSEVLRTTEVEELFSRIYYYRCATLLAGYLEDSYISVEYSSDYALPEDFLNPEIRAPEKGDIVISFTVSEGEESGQKSLDIVYEIAVPAVEVSFLEAEDWRTGFTVAVTDENERYEITSWKLRQNPIDYDSENPTFG